MSFGGLESSIINSLQSPRSKTETQQHATNDAKGNLTEYEINGKEYEVDYDLDNRIIKVDVDNDDVDYRYDALGRRVIRQEGTTKTALIWWGNSENAEHKHQAGQTVIQNDIMAHPSRLNSVIARAVDGSKFKLEWYHKNYLDHVYAVSDDSGDILEHYRYTAFGEVTIYNSNGNQVATTQIDNHILWNTRRRDELTGFYMYKFRHYSAELGRWPSRDPIEENGGVNLYSFVGNDGVNGFDYLGQVNWAKGKILAKDQKLDPAEPDVGDFFEVKTDAGNPIWAWEGKGKFKGNYICHGYTFGGSPNLSVAGMHVPQILKDDKWIHIPCCKAKKSDIMIFYNVDTYYDGFGFEISHSGIIENIHLEALVPNDPFISRYRPDETKSNIKSKWGLRGNLNVASIAVNVAAYPNTYACYSKTASKPGGCCDPGEYENWDKSW